MPSTSELYQLASTNTNKIEAELKRLNRWISHQLPPEVYDNMGAFGSNTMAFEQWLQFILIPRIHTTVEEKGDFPESSSIAPYAIRVFDGDSKAGHLHDLLYELDKLINEKDQRVEHSMPVNVPDEIPTVAAGDSEIPPVLFTLAEVLPQFEGEDLESQLQTYDTFLSFLSPTVRPSISKLLKEAANKTSNEASKVRILEAARSVSSGGLAAAPYNHEEAMKRYREEHKKSFPQ